MLRYARNFAHAPDRHHGPHNTSSYKLCVTAELKMELHLDFFGEVFLFITYSDNLFRDTHTSRQIHHNKRHPAKLERVLTKVTKNLHVSRAHL